MTAEFKKCWMLKIYTGEDVIVGNDPLYRTILEEARRLKIAGATVIKGIEGYATEVRGIDRRPVSLFTGVSNLPVLVTIVDQKENLEKLIPFAPLQIPVAVGTTYALGRVVTEWLKAGKPADLSPFKTVYDDALREAKKNIELFKNDPKKDEPLGDESKKYDL